MDRYAYDQQQLGICPECGQPVLRSQKRNHEVKNGTLLHWDCFIIRCKQTDSLGSRPTIDFELENAEYHRRKKEERDNIRTARS